MRKETRKVRRVVSILNLISIISVSLFPLVMILDWLECGYNGNHWILWLYIGSVILIVLSCSLLSKLLEDMLKTIRKLYRM